MPALFFVDGEAAISVASTMVPPRRSDPRAVLGDGSEDRLRQLVSLEKMPEMEDRRLVGDRIAAELEAAERAHRVDVVERLLDTWIGEIVPLLQEIGAQQQAETAAARPSAPPSDGAARLGFERRPRNHRRHLGQEHVALRPLLLGREVDRRGNPRRINGISVR